MLTASPRPSTNKGALRAKVVADLRRRIESSTYAPGERLPSFAALSQEFGVSDITIRAALKELVDGGFLRSRPGSGMYVEESLPGQQSHPASAYTDKAQPRLMSDVVAVLSVVPRNVLPSPEEHQSGFTSYIGYGAMATAQDRGLHALALHPDLVLDKDGEAGKLNRLLEIHPQGVIIPDTVHAQTPSFELAQALTAGGLRVVVYGDAPELAAFDRVSSGHEAGSYELTRWLISQGRRRILNVWATPATQYWFKGRWAGYERAMQEAGLPTLPAVKVPGAGIDSEAAFEASARQMGGHLIEYLSGADAIDSIMAGTDTDAFVAAAACRLFGKQPHGDVSVVGYDNYWAGSPARKWEPVGPQATVDKLNFETGAAMVQLLCARLAGELPAEAQCRIINPKVVVNRPL